MARKRLQACVEGISSLFNGVFCHKFSIQVCVQRNPTKVCYNNKNVINIFTRCIWILFYVNTVLIYSNFITFFKTGVWIILIRIIYYSNLNDENSYIFSACLWFINIRYFLLLLDAKGNKLKKCEIQNKRFIFYKLTILDF